MYYNPSITFIMEIREDHNNTYNKYCSITSNGKVIFSKEDFIDNNTRKLNIYVDDFNYEMCANCNKYIFGYVNKFKIDDHYEECIYFKKCDNCHKWFKVDELKEHCDECI